MNWPRIALLVFNTILMLLGLGLLAGGAYTYVAGAQYNITVNVAIGVMVCGGGIFLLSFIGCFGAMWEKKVMLYIYAVIILVLIGGEVAFIIISYVRPDLVESTLSTGWDNASNTTRTAIQDNLVCCGFYNDTDRASLPCPTGANGTGCYNQLLAKYTQYSTYVQAAGYTLVGLEVVIFALTITMACKGKTEEQKRQEQLEEARKMNREVNDYS